MRVNPVGYNPNMNRNVSFGKIDKKHRKKILASLPLSGKEKTRQQQIKTLDENYGVLLRWGGPKDKRGVVYADLDIQHAQESPLKAYYYSLSPECCGPSDKPKEKKGVGCLNRLEKPKVFQELLQRLAFINNYEDPDGTIPPRTPIPQPEDDKNEHASKAPEKDNFDIAYELYGIR